MEMEQEMVEMNGFEEMDLMVSGSWSSGQEPIKLDIDMEPIWSALEAGRHEENDR